MIKDDDFDSISIEVTTGRLTVCTDAGMQQVTLPLTPSDTAELLGSLILRPAATASSAVDDAAGAQARSVKADGELFGKEPGGRAEGRRLG
jgi:hypothetical protein